MPAELEHDTPSFGPPSTIAQWLDSVDQLGPQIPTQALTDKSLPHPLGSERTLEDNMLNLQIGVITAEILDDPELFDPEKAKEFVDALINPTKDISPQGTVNHLVEKQRVFLEKGEGWQFGKVGLEVHPLAQRIVFKLHALTTALEHYCQPGANQYEDQLADIFTQRILDRSSQMRILANAIGPTRFSVRWVDFLEGRENPSLLNWIKEAQTSKQLPQRDYLSRNLLSITAGESGVTPGTVVQLLEKRTIRSTGAVPPLRSSDVANTHAHNNKVEVYLPLMGPVMLKVQYDGVGDIHTYTADPNFNADLDLSRIGARMVDGQPAVVYDGKTYRAEEGQRVISIPLEDSRYLQLYVVRPGDIHLFDNVGISPAPAYALAMGFPREEGLDLSNDFNPTDFSK